ncbi:MAG TPA: hypothetical protein VIV12_27295 [Streptosporangiaceae bacterium]
MTEPGGRRWLGRGRREQDGAEESDWITGPAIPPVRPHQAGPPAGWAGSGPDWGYRRPGPGADPVRGHDRGANREMGGPGRRGRLADRFGQTLPPGREGATGPVPGVQGVPPGHVQGVSSGRYSPPAAQPGPLSGTGPHTLGGPQQDLLRGGGPGADTSETPGRSARARGESGRASRAELAIRDSPAGLAEVTAPGMPAVRAEVAIRDRTPGRAEVAIRDRTVGRAELAIRGPATGRSVARRPARVSPARSGPARQSAATGRSVARVTLWAGTAVLAVAACVFGVLAIQTRGSGPAHIVATPSTLGSFVRRPQLEQQMNAGQLQQEVISKSAGQASHVVSAVYENRAGVAGAAAPKIILFIGGNLSQVTPSGFITSFTNQFKGAQAVSAGPMGGLASCVASNAAGQVTLCAWADNDTFGVVASPSMNVHDLSAQLTIVRPGVEHLAK